MAGVTDAMAATGGITATGTIDSPLDLLGMGGQDTKVMSLYR